MSQVNEPGSAVAFQALRDVSKMDSPPRHAMRIVRERVGQLAELVHMSCAVIRSQLAASIVHEANQTITALVVSGNAGLRWPAEAESTARVEKTRKAPRSVIRHGERAAYVIETASGRPEATSTAIGSLVERRGRHW